MLFPFCAAICCISASDGLIRRAESVNNRYTINICDAFALRHPFQRLAPARRTSHFYGRRASLGVARRCGVIISRKVIAVR